MRIILLAFALFLSYFVSAQDYFALVVKNDDTTYNYPENAEITVIDSLGNRTRIGKNDAVTLKGDYTLSIATPGRKNQKFLKATEVYWRFLYFLPNGGTGRQNWITIP